MKDGLGGQVLTLPKGTCRKTVLGEVDGASRLLFVELFSVWIWTALRAGSIRFGRRHYFCFNMLLFFLCRTDSCLF